MLQCVMVCCSELQYVAVCRVFESFTDNTTRAHAHIHTHSLWLSMLCTRVHTHTHTHALSHHFSLAFSIFLVVCTLSLSLSLHTRTLTHTCTRFLPPRSVSLFPRSLALPTFLSPLHKHYTHTTTLLLCGALAFVKVRTWCAATEFALFEK